MHQTHLLDIRRFHKGSKLSTGEHPYVVDWELKKQQQKKINLFSILTSEIINVQHMAISSQWYIYLINCLLLPPSLLTRFYLYLVSALLGTAPPTLGALSNGSSGSAFLQPFVLNHLFFFSSCLIWNRTEANAWLCQKDRNPPADASSCPVKGPTELFPTHSQALCWADNLLQTGAQLKEISDSLINRLSLCEKRRSSNTLLFSYR